MSDQTPATETAAASGSGGADSAPKPDMSKPSAADSRMSGEISVRGGLQDLINERNSGGSGQPAPAASDSKVPGSSDILPPSPPQEASGNSSDDPAPAAANKPPAVETGLVEVDGKQWFYHPQKHAEGADVYPNAYKSRDAAEEAALAKVEHIRKVVSELQEKKRSVRSLGVPEVLGKDLSGLENLNEDTVLAMDDNQLRDFLKDTDAFTKKARTKLEHVQKSQAEGAKSQQYRTRLQQVQDQANKALEAFDIDPTTYKAADVNAFFKDLETRKPKAVDAALKKDVEALDAFAKDEDAYYDMGHDKFAKEVRKRTEALAEKRLKLMQEYDQHAESVKQYIEMMKSVADKDGDTQGDTADAPVKPSEQFTPQELAAMRKNALEEFEDDMQLAGQEVSEDKFTHFSSWAYRNREKYNELISADDVFDAWDSYNTYLDQRRAELRLKQNGGQGTGVQDREGIPRPDPGLQLKPMSRDRGFAAAAELSSLASEANRRHQR